MIRASIAFFILALVAYVFGARGIMGLSMEIGVLFLSIFIVLAVITFIASLITGKKTNIV